MFDRAEAAAALAAHGAVARVVIAEVAGSAPREAGASMLVWRDGQSGTIGGGALEWEAARQARDLLAAGGGPIIARIPLGPALGQCCGGAVTLVTEVMQAAALPEAEAPAFARPLDGSAMPLAVRRILDRARGQGIAPAVTLVQGWLVEPTVRPRAPVWIWGAGHVGRALAGVLAPLPDLAVTWVDTAPDRFPPSVPPGVTALPVPDPVRAMALAPARAHHLILTYSHALDLDLCHAALVRGFASAGLIGSATKWARFRARLGQLGHPRAGIARIACPMGDPRLGKHPQAIALGVAAALLQKIAATTPSAVSPSVTPRQEQAR